MNGTITDYAQHLIRLEKMSKEVSDLCLHRDYNEALVLIPRMITELRVLSATVAIMDNDAKARK